MRSENNAESVGCMLSHMVGECKQPAELETSGVWGELWSWQPRSWQPLGYGVSSSWQPLTSGPLTSGVGSEANDLWGSQGAGYPRGLQKGAGYPRGHEGAGYPRGHGCRGHGCAPEVMDVDGEFRYERKDL